MQPSASNSVRLCCTTVLISLPEESRIEKPEEPSTMHRFERAVKHADDASLVLREGNNEASGFDAWLRNRAQGEISFINPRTLQEKYGIETIGYDPVPLPALKVHSIQHKQFGPVKEVFL